MNFSFLNGLKNPKEVLGGFKNPKKLLDNLREKAKDSVLKNSVYDDLNNVRTDKCDLYNEIVGYIKTIGNINYKAGCSEINVTLNKGILEVTCEEHTYKYNKDNFSQAKSEIRNVLKKYITDNSVDVFINIGNHMNKLHDIFMNIWEYPDNAMIIGDTKIRSYTAKCKCKVFSDNEDFLYVTVGRNLNGKEVSFGLLMTHKAIIRVYRTEDVAYGDVLTTLRELSSSWWFDVTFESIRERIREYGGCCFCYNNCFTYYVGRLGRQGEECIIVCTVDGDLYLRKASNYRSVADIYSDKLMDPFIRARPIDSVYIGPEDGVIR